MKTKLPVSLILAFCLLLGLKGTARAENWGEADHIADKAGLLREQELEQLEARAEEIQGKYGCAPYIITVDDYRDYGSGDIFETAMDIYQTLELGCGQEKNGILLMLSMEERDYAMVTYGGLSHASFTDHGQKYVEESFLKHFRDDDWAGGFEAYLLSCGELLGAAAQGRSYDVDSSPRGFNILIILIPLALSSVVCGGFAYRMKSARLKSQARDYVPEGGVDMRIVQDRFTHRTVMRQKISTPKSGGGTSINSRGFSGRSGKF